MGGFAEPRTGDDEGGHPHPTQVGHSDIEAGNTITVGATTGGEEDGRPSGHSQQTRRSGSGTGGGAGAPRAASTILQGGSAQQALSRQELLARGMSGTQADMHLVRQSQDEIITLHFRRWVVCIAMTLVLTQLAALGLSVWVIVEFAQATREDCDVPIRTWATVLFAIWGIRGCSKCINRCCCCWDSEQHPDPPIRVLIKDYLLLIFDFVWVVCLGFHWMITDGGGEALPACKIVEEGLYTSAKVFIAFQVANMLWLVLSVIGLRNMMRLMIRRGLLTTSDGAPPEAIEENTEVVKLTDNELEENPSCPICMDNYENDGPEPIAKVKGCGHFFHKACLKNWLKTARSCPLCRADLGILNEGNIICTADGEAAAATAAAVSVATAERGA